MALEITQVLMLVPILDDLSWVVLKMNLEGRGQVKVLGFQEFLPKSKWWKRGSVSAKLSAKFEKIAEAFKS